MRRIAIVRRVDLGTEPWRPGKELQVWTILGRVRVDFRQAEIEDVIRLRLFTLFGGAEIIVSEGLPVDLRGFSLFGGNALKRYGKEPSLNDTRQLNVHSTTVFGGTKVTDWAPWRYLKTGQCSWS